MSPSPQSRQPRGIPSGGQFAAESHAEPQIVLEGGPVVDAGEIVGSILKDLREQRHRGAGFDVVYSDLFFGIRGKKADPERLLAEWTSHGGRCPTHASSEARYPEDHCAQCTLAAMATARTSPAPEPVPVGPAPRRPEPVHLEEGPSTVIEEAESSSTTSRELTGDEKVEAAIRQMFDAPAGTPVTIVQQEWKDWSTWTGDYSTEIEVICGHQKMQFDGLPELLKALDSASRPEPVKMALRFMRAVDAERPLLQGTAAVYLRAGQHTDPQPVFGRVINCYLHGRDQFMDFAHSDGRREYISFSRVVAIQETDQSSIYPEP